MDATRHVKRVALVTGTASGIGRAVALRLLSEGAAVAATDLNSEGLKQLEQQAASSDRLTTWQADITVREEVEVLVQAVLSEYGRIDVLANVAGIMDRFLPIGSLDDETWERVMAVNTKAVMMLCRAVIPGMVERGTGAIVNVGSAAGLRGGAAGLSYTASKHALMGMTKSIAWVYSTSGIRCNEVAPGGVETNISTTAAPGDEFGFERLQPVHQTAVRTAQPDEIATLVSWLASDEATNVNGAIIPADGGWSAG